MVNSLSRPNSRPPAPVECGGRTPLWNRETCLPVDRTVMPAPARKSALALSQPAIHPHTRRGRPRFRNPISEIRARCRPQSRQKPL